MQSNNGSYPNNDSQQSFGPQFQPGVQPQPGMPQQPGAQPQPGMQPQQPEVRMQPGMQYQPGMPQQPGAQPQPGMQPGPYYGPYGMNGQMFVPVFDKKPHKKFFSRVGLSYFTFFIVTSVLQAVVALVARQINPDIMDNYAAKIILALAPMYLVGAPIALLIMKKLPAGKPQGTKWNAGQIIGGFFVAYGLVYVSNIIGTTLGAVIEALVPGAQAATNDTQELVASGSILVNILAIAIIGPIVEELLFRKMLCDRLKVYGDGITMVVTGLVFAIFHGNLTQGAYTFTLGMFFAYVYLKTGKLAITIAYHIGINFMGGVLPLIVMKDIDLSEYLHVVQSGDTDRILEFAENNAASLGYLALYIVILVGCALSGIIILIVTLARKRVVLNPGRIMIPKGMRFSTIIVNVGMILYIIMGIIIMLLAMVPA